MNTISNAEIQLKRSVWQNTIILTLGFWLSSSLILDWVIMPSLYVSGMMTQSSFATAGYTIFWSFNRVELLCAGLILTSVLAFKKSFLDWKQISVVLAVLMLLIASVQTYLLTPQMSAIGVQLGFFETVDTVPESMNLLHGAYWFFEVLKLTVGSILFSLNWR